VDFIVSNGYTPCLEFAPAAQAYVNSESTNRFANGASVNYFDNRYWTMWKLPMFGCQDGSQVLKEVSACTSAFPDAYIRLVAFDNIKQVQCAGFLVHRPAGIKEYQDTTTRSV
jgi:ribulose-bisphosphate carboxylase small chain